MWEPLRVGKTRVDDYYEMHELLENKNCFTIVKNWQHFYKYILEDKARSLADKVDNSVVIRGTHIYNRTQTNEVGKYLKC